MCEESGSLWGGEHVGDCLKNSPFMYTRWYPGADLIGEVHQINQIWNALYIIVLFSNDNVLQFPGMEAI